MPAEIKHYNKNYNVKKRSVYNAYTQSALSYHLSFPDIQTAGVVLAKQSTTA